VRAIKCAPDELFIDGREAYIYFPQWDGAAEAFLVYDFEDFEGVGNGTEWNKRYEDAGDGGKDGSGEVSLVVRARRVDAGRSKLRRYKGLRVEDCVWVPVDPICCRKDPRRLRLYRRVLRAELLKISRGARSSDDSRARIVGAQEQKDAAAGLVADVGFLFGCCGFR